MFTVEGQLSFYGYLTNTHYKYILVKLEDKIEGTPSSDSSVKDFFRKINKIHIGFISNPFMILDTSSIGDGDSDFHIPTNSAERDQILSSKRYFEQQLEKSIDNTVLYYQQYI